MIRNNADILNDTRKSAGYVKNHGTVEYALQAVGKDTDGDLEQRADTDPDTAEDFAVRKSVLDHADTAGSRRHLSSQAATAHSGGGLACRRWGQTSRRWPS